MTNIPERTNYTSVLANLCMTAPQDVLTHLTTSLQQIYNINQNGGHGSRRKVAQLLLELGLQPNR